VRPGTGNPVTAKSINQITSSCTIRALSGTVFSGSSLDEPAIYVAELRARADEVIE
jgi:hypothetical protein